MPAPILIGVEGVSKRYCQNLKRSLWYGLRDVSKELIGLSSETEELRPGEFWALKDVSFEVRRGESIGVMGHNGAGKTTLLKLINGLVKPTRGRIAVTGSVRALITLGAGFDPVLTGRENIWTSCSVLGYSDREIEANFDKIVDFSELGDFIDAPVRSYSSGMLARLGFSVAVQTKPDILLVDEVLAVGDLNFAIKCYRKMTEFREQGTSFILVTHNPYAIRTNCDRAIWIEHGEMQMIGDANIVSGAYEEFVAREDVAPKEKRYFDDAVRIPKVTYPPIIQSGDDFVLELEIVTSRSIDNPIIGLTISNVTAQNVVSNVSHVDGAELSLEKGKTLVRVKYNELFLARGIYYIGLVVAEKYINNQVAALLHGHKFEVRTSPDDHNVGIYRKFPIWECSR